MNYVKIDVKWDLIYNITEKLWWELSECIRIQYEKLQVKI